MFNFIYHLYQTLDSVIIFSFLSYTLLILCGLKKNHCCRFILIPVIHNNSVSNSPSGTFFHLSEAYRSCPNSLLVLFRMHDPCFCALRSYCPGGYTFH